MQYYTALNKNDDDGLKKTLLCNDEVLLLLRRPKLLAISASQSSDVFEPAPTYQH